MKNRIGLSNLSTWISAAALTLLLPLPAHAVPIQFAVGFGMYGDIPVPARYLAASSRTDLAVFRPSTGYWYVRDAYNPFLFTSQQWGQAGDIPVPGDFDGDGLADYAVWRPSTGVWWVIQSATGTVRSQRWGMYGDVPVVGDYDGDGRADFAVWRPGSGVWWVLNSRTGVGSGTQWGTFGDVPVPGPYDSFIGEDYTVFRQYSNSGLGTAYWYGLGSTSGSYFLFRQWGQVADIPLRANFYCSGSVPAIFRPGNGLWYVYDEPLPPPVQFGMAGDIPLGVDFVGSQAADYVVFRPSNGVWYILENVNPC